MYGCNLSDETLNDLGYHKTSPPLTIGQMLYYFSHLAEITDPLPGHQYTNFRCLYPYSMREYMSKLDYTLLGFKEDCKPDQLYFEFDPLQEELFAVNNWTATAIYPNGERLRVMYKIWDPWKTVKERPLNHSELQANNEAAIYKELHSLWGGCVPYLIGHGIIQFFHGVIIQFIENVWQFSLICLTALGLASLDAKSHARC
jgi:hypothetical protein